MSRRSVRRPQLFERLKETGLRSIGSAARKGSERGEHKLRAMHESEGIPCRRVPLSGSADGYSGDLIVDGEWKAEVKWRGSGEGFRVIERWLGAFDLLFLVRDRQTPTVVMPWEMYAELMQRPRGEEESEQGHACT